MRRRLCTNTALALIAGLAWGLAACTTPHHSNALIFGTNTSFGLDVGQNATGVPSIMVGYRRQEAVFMPLVANVRYDANGIPTACAVYPGVNYPPPGSALANGQAVPQVPPCFLVGQNGGAIDSYSVLASFGARFSATATQPEASGGLAQFFATGLAAQALAIRGGSSLVAVSAASEAAATADTDAAVAALYNAPAVANRIPEILAAGTGARDVVLAYLRDHTTDANFAEELGLIETAAAEPGAVSYLLCDGLARQACLDALASDAGLRIITSHPGDWPTAVQQRKQTRGIQ